MMKSFAATLLAVGMLAAQEVPAIGSISGVVTDAITGAPLPQLPVQGGSAPRTTTDTDGRYTLSNVRPGRHSITVGSRSRADSAYGLRVVTLAAGQDLGSVDFRLEVKGSISGRVLDENNEPIPGLEMVLVGTEYRASALHYYRRNVAFTNDHGEYRIQNILSGTPYLILARQRHLNMNPVSEVPADPELRRRVPVPTYYPNSASPQGGLPIVLRSGEQKEGVDIRVLRSPSYCIEGILRVEGRPAELNFWIHEQEMSFGMGPSGVTTGIPPGGKSGPDGKIRICELHPGEYRLTAFSGDLNAPIFFATTLVAITNVDVENVTVVPQPRLPLPVQVVWAGAPPEKPVDTQITVILTSMHRTFGAFGGDRSTVPGAFSLNLLMDEYFVRIRGLSDSLYLKDITYGNTSIVRGPLRLGSAIAGPEMRVVIGHDGGFIRVLVRDKDGKAVPDTNVILMPRDTNSEPDLAAMRITGRTDQNGYYASAALPPGYYYVIATSSAVIDWSPESIAKLWTARTKAKGVDVEPEATVQLTLEPMILN